MIKTPLTPLELEGLLKHKLPIDRPSQLSDAFRLGMAFALSQPKPLEKDYIEKIVVPIIGTVLILDGYKCVHIQDINNLQQTALVGTFKGNLVDELKWVGWDRLSKVV